METKFKAIIYILISSLIITLGQILWKIGSNSLTNIHSFIFNPYIISGFILYGIAFIFMIIAFKNGELSVLRPILATNFIWISIFSPLVFVSDYMTPIKWAGVATIIVGIFFVSYGGGKK